MGAVQVREDGNGEQSSLLRVSQKGQDSAAGMRRGGADQGTPLEWNQFLHSHSLLSFSYFIFCFR